MRLLTWLVRAFILFVLFAFALNNQQTVTVRWFFGLDWQAPLVFVLLIVFVAGCGVGVAAMVPAWWRSRQAARKGQAAVAAVAGAQAPPGEPAPAASGRPTHPVT